ncbi:hypothetical protein GOP47_0027531 [Adiantum capillus-veneris]|nr:hypothetical protein GOP47_0027531 [Adiantum capillus-veneris]
MDSPESTMTMQKVVEMTKASLERGDSPLLWSIEVARCLDNAGLEIPSLPLAHALASCLFTCFSFSALSAYLHHAMASQLVSSFHVIGLLTPRVLQSRRSRPEVYSLYLELMSTYIFHLGHTKAMSCCDMVVKAVDEVLQLSVLSGVSASDFGTATVQFLLILFWRLMEATLEDWRTFYGKSDKQDTGFQNSVQFDSTMEVDEGLNEQQMREREHLQKANWIAAIRLAAKMLENKKTFSLLRLAQRTSLKPWGMVTSCFQSLDAIISDALPISAIEALTHLLASYQQRGFSQEPKGYQFPVLQVLIESRTPSWPYGNCSEVGREAAWLSFDIFMEDVMVGTRIIATSVVEALAELVKTMQSIHNASWHDTFLALWISAVRLPQREMENMEGPKPLFGSRLSMPLSIVPLASALLIEEEEKLLLTGSESGSLGTGIEKDTKIMGKRRAAFVSSLKVLGQFEDLLTLPQKVATAANQAAASAAAFVSAFNHGNMAFESVGVTDGSSGLRAVGNLRHLIVDTCIARGLLDTSAYFWPDYVGAAGNNISRSVQAQVSPWKAFMDGAPLSASLRSSLLSTPAKSVAELEKIFHIAISGPEEERPAAASILCGASLMRSWNVQEHTVSFVLRLLSPPASNDGKLNGHHLIQHAPMLYATLGAIHTTDALHVLSLYGRTCEVAAALLPLCEVFGSLSPTVPLVTGSKEEISVLTVFSLAFLILIKICKFHRAPLEQWTTGSGLNLFNNTSLEYLLVRHNMQVVSSLGISSENKSTEDLEGSKKLLPPSNFSKTSAQSSLPQYVSIDSFPRLQAWFLQQKSCITTSSIPGVASVDSVHQVGDRLLAMMLKKANKSANLPTTSGASVTSSVSDDAGGKPLLPAWDLLAAVPFVVDTLLTACGHGKILPRDLTTGLRELVDFCPASLASIISFLEAEVTRGISRSAPMNGKDWPNPAANLLSMEAEIREMLSSSGVDVPSCVTGSNSGNILVTLPLPLATLLSLTITFKVDKFSELVISVGGPALQNIAGGTACTAVVAALWSQKVRRWHDYIVFGSAVAAMKKDKTAASRVLKSCFSVTLGTTNNLLTAHGGVGALLGHTNWMHPPSGGRGPIPPGILFLRICPSLHDIMFLPVTSKLGSRLRCLQSSLATTISRVSQAATLSASFLFVSGGSTLGQLLYSEALPAWFLTGQKLEGKPVVGKSGNTALLEGYAVAYFTVLAGMLVWGGASEPKEGQESLKIAAVSSHMRFLASALDGKMSLACDLITWKAYVRSFISLVLTCANSWILYVDVETLRRIAVALRTWHDYDLALALLESGGTATMHVASEFSLSLPTV